MENIRATVAETTQRYFTCRYCGARGEVELLAQGDSGWQESTWYREATITDAASAAETDLMLDAERVLGLVKCPTCKRRDARYVRWGKIRVAAWFALGGSIWFLGGTELAIGTIGCALAGCWQTYREHTRYRRANRARILRLRPGKLAPPPELPPLAAPPPELPVARALTAPVIQPPKPTVAPAPVVPRGPGEEPAFLREGDKGDVPM